MGESRFLRELDAQKKPLMFGAMFRIPNPSAFSRMDTGNSDQTSQHCVKVDPKNCSFPFGFPLTWNEACEH